MATTGFRYPKTVVALWLLFLACCGAYAPKLPSVALEHGLVADGEYARVQHILAADFQIPADPVVLLFEKRESAAPERFRRFIRETLARMQGIVGLEQVVSPLDRADMRSGNFAYALLGFARQGGAIGPVLDEIRRRLPADGDVSVKLTGKPVVQADVNRASGRDFKRAELIGLPVAFILLRLAFGGFVPAIIPVAVGLVAVSATMGVMYWIGTVVPLSHFVVNVIPMVGFALSIDFALMLVSRYREELAGKTAAQALAVAMRTAGGAVLWSAACVFLALTGTLLVPLPIFRTVALAAMAVLTVSVLANLTLLPAILSVLRPFVRPSAPEERMGRGRPSVWHAVSLCATKKPIRMGLLALLLLSVCFLPLLRMKLVIPDASSLPAGYESRLAAEAWHARFAPSADAAILIVVPSERAAADGWLAKLKRDPDVQEALGPFVRGEHALIRVTLAGDPASERTKQWIRRWEREGGEAGAKLLIGGEPKYRQEVFDAIFRHMGKALLFILASNSLVLFAAFRSVLVPLKTIAMNLLSLGASFGLLARIFPDDIAVMIPVFVFGLVFGISMDYGVFLVSRIFEAYRRTGDNDFAIRSGLASTGTIIVSAAAILIAVTAPFAFADVAGVRQLGIGVAASILIDATVIRLILVPSLMKLLGRWNWWAPG